MTSLLLLAISAATLWVLWRILAITFALIDHWQAAAAESREDAQATKGTGSSVGQ